ncbi:uncharacterized protein EMH_0007180 [Eimeria mitis]|uniref:Fungal lipase-type domain-containing protein n=1 Tax=Eimeria mitis TaxID=44415 RepID=U6K1C6_9EIME|nr:uncharacterized protein EMH_0007180 [Eimeria mitis]CDJ30786.1 hypothetical protein, conserved [Eimeria mitis]
MVWTSWLPAALRLRCALLIIHVAGILGMGLFEEELKSYPIVGIPAADARRSDTRLSSEEATSGPVYNEEHVHLKPDGTVSFECPRSVCGIEFYFGRTPKEEEGSQSQEDVTDKNDTSRASYVPGEDESVATASAENKSQIPAEVPLLKDIVHTTDMTWLGTDEKMHQLAYMKNSTCGGLYVSPSQLPVATADLACSLSNLDMNSVYLKRYNSHRLRLGPVKVCETVQSYPERLLQGFPQHVHPDHPSYVQLPIYSYFRKAGAEVAFPKDAPTIFQPRIYDGNVPVNRKSRPSNLFALALDLFFGAKGETERGGTESGSTDPVPNVDSATSQKSNTSKQENTLENEELQKGNPQPPETAGDSASGETNGATTEEWKREMYRAWHCLWILNLVAYEASDIWEWVKNHKVNTFIFPPWKVTEVGTLRTAEVVPMRWRDLSPRFHVEPNLEPLSQQDLTPGNDGPNSESQEGTAKGETGDNSRREGPTERVGPDTSSRACEGDAAVADRQPEGSSRVNSSETGEHAKPHADCLGKKTYTVPSTRSEGQAGANKPQEPISTDVSNNEEAGEKQGVESLAGRSSSAEGDNSGPDEVPEGCLPYITDMSLFKRFGWPSGRLVAAGPSGSKVPDEAGSTTDEWVDGSWRPKIIGSNIKCLPAVHPDTCGLTASFSRVHESPWVWLLERDENMMASNRVDNLDYADIVWIFRGTFVSKQWLLNGMGVAVPYKTLSKRGRFHYGLTYLFDKAVRPLMEKHLERLEHQIVGRKTPLVIVFSGHSLGAAIADMAAWYFAKRAKTLVDKNMLQIRTVTFGSPSWGDQVAYDDLLASGVKAQEISMDIDPVSVLFGEEELTKLSHKKPFLMKLYVEDMDKVEVASTVPGAPPFSGRIWTRPIYRPTPILHRLAAMFLDLENVDMAGHYATRSIVIAPLREAFHKPRLVNDRRVSAAVNASCAPVAAYYCGY